LAAGAEPDEVAVVVRGPVDRLTAGLPHPWPTIIDWVVTIVVAVAAVLAIKEWVVNPYRIPSSSMEPTLHCAEPAQGCLARFSDRVLANRFIYRFRDPERGEIVVFKTPPAAASCLEGGGGQTFVKRIIGLPGDTINLRGGFVFINGKRIDESYLPQEHRGKTSPATNRPGPFRLGTDEYFFMGDNRTSSCDSREWGAVPRENLIGPVFAVYWPPQRIGFR
jgi:signal peptidase I